MLASFSQSTFVPLSGKALITLNNSIINGYQNQVDQYQTANTMSLPLPGVLCNLDVQSAAQMMVVGYKNIITDPNYVIVPGEFTSYSPTWYQSTRITGVEIQQANSTNKENMVMGQSTNNVLNDMMSLMIEIIQYLGTHSHTYSPGGGSPTPTSVPIQPVPDDSQVAEDQSYVQSNKNLAITGTYEPYSSMEAELDDELDE